jgi:hypothetical protein
MKHQTKEYREKYQELRQEYQRIEGKCVADKTFYRWYSKYKQWNQSLNLGYSVDLFSQNIKSDFKKFLDLHKKLGLPPKNLTASRKAFKLIDKIAQQKTAWNFQDLTTFLDEELSEDFTDICSTNEINISNWFRWFKDSEIKGFDTACVKNRMFKFSTDDLKFVAYKASKYILNKKYTEYTGENNE